MPKDLNTSRETKVANKATSKALTNLLGSSYEFETATYHVKVVHSRDLKHAQTERIFSLFEENMYHLYKNSSFGWNPKDKHKELFNSLSRFIVVQDDEGGIVAFVMFRFEHEYEENVIYIYDIQVSSSIQSKGLGKRLMVDVDLIAKHFSMEKVMLTVLKNNIRALSIYENIGFILDKTSPDTNDAAVEGSSESSVCDYKIMSKTMVPDN